MLNGVKIRIANIDAPERRLALVAKARIGELLKAGVPQVRIGDPATRAGASTATAARWRRSLSTGTTSAKQWCNGGGRPCARLVGQARTVVRAALDAEHLVDGQHLVHGLDRLALQLDSRFGVELADEPGALVAFQQVADQRLGLAVDLNLDND